VGRTRFWHSEHAGAELHIQRRYKTGIFEFVLAATQEELVKLLNTQFGYEEIKYLREICGGP